jgi:hypothetical protein
MNMDGIVWVPEITKKLSHNQNLSAPLRDLCRAGGLMATLGNTLGFIGVAARFLVDK